MANWKRTTFRNLEMARLASEVLGGQPSDIQHQSETVSFFTTATGYLLAFEEGSDWVMQKKVPVKKGFRQRNPGGPTYRFEDEGRVGPWVKSDKTLEDVEDEYGNEPRLEVLEARLVRGKGLGSEYEYVELVDGTVLTRAITPYK